MQLKNIGIFLLLVAILLGTAIFRPEFLSDANVQSLIRWTSLFGLCSIGVAFVIITGGIDLSIGSLIALSGCLFITVLNMRYQETNIILRVDKVESIEGENGEITRIEMPLNDQVQFASDDTLVRTKGNGVVTVASHSLVDGNFRVELRETQPNVSVGDEFRWRPFQHRSIPLSIAIVILFAMAIGLLHGLLITKVKLQPFVVTLCGLLIYRGAARVLSGDQPLGFQTKLDAMKELFRGNCLTFPIPGLPFVSEGHWGTYQWSSITKDYVLDAAGNRQPVGWLEFIDLPVTGLLLIVVAAVAWVLLNLTVFGRYLLAMGNNLNAAKFSGINTDRMTIAAYVICSAMAGLSGILFCIDLNAVEPSNTGEFYELYAIAAAVLGGCSLRGGTGSIIGVVIGTAVMRSLYLAIASLQIPRTYEFIVIGVALLTAVLADELLRFVTARRQLSAQKKMMRQSQQANSG